MSDSFDVLYDKARRAFTEGFPEHALVPATEAAKLAPDRWDARLLLARVWLAQGGAARAAADAKAAIDLAHGAMPAESLQIAREVLSLAALQTKDFDAAERELKGLAVDGHAPSLVRLLAVLSDRQKLDDARTVATDCAPAHPALEAKLAAASAAMTSGDSLSVQRAIAEIALAAGMHADARTRFQQVLARDPSDAAAIDGLQRATASSTSEPAQQSDVMAMLRWSSSLFVALGLALLVFSIWRRDLIQMNSAFPPQYWMTAGVAALGLGIGLVLLSRRRDA